MLDLYSPYERIQWRNPLFQRELRLLRWKPHPQLIRQINFRTLGWLVALQIVLFLVTIFTFEVGSLFPLAIILGVQILISMGADCYTLLGTIYLWQSRRQRELWDALRLTNFDEMELVTILSALAELRSWLALQIDSTQRVALTAIAFIAAGGMLCTLPTNALTAAWDVFFMRITLIAFVFMQGVLYLRAPLWRYRTTVMLGVWVAEITRETITALFTGIAVVFGLRLTVIFGVLTLAALYSRSTGGGSVLFSIVMICLTGLLPPVTWRLYAGLHAWAARQTIRHMFQQ